MKKEYKTLNTFKKVDDNVYLLEFKDDYKLEEMLSSGKKGIVSAGIKIQRLLSSNGSACSTFNCKTKNNEYLFGRNFDYKKAPCLVLWSSPKKGYKSMAIVDTTMFLTDISKITNKKRMLLSVYASMDGINEKGLCGAILEKKGKETKQKNGKTPITTTVALRAILDTCKNVDEVVKFLKKYDMHDVLFANYHYQFLDANGKSIIVEYDKNKMHVIEKDYLVSTNFLLTSGADNRKERGRNRYHKLVDLLEKKKHILSDIDTMKALASVTMKYKHKYLKHDVITLWSSVYNTNDKTLMLCAGMNYEDIYKFDINKPLEYEHITGKKINVEIVNEDTVVESNKVITVNNLVKTYGKEVKTVAVNNISFDINKGEFLTILGSSGSGKSTLLNLIGGMDKPDSGSIIFNDKDITNYSDKQMTLYRKNNIGFIFQSFNLINELTVRENIELTANTSKNPHIIDAVLEITGLKDKENKYPGQLSGGEQQRVSIARALSKDTDILLCDEPTGALDYNTGKQILISLEKLSKDYHKTIVFVTHTREISKMADRTINMRNGQIMDITVNTKKADAASIEW